MLVGVVQQLLVQPPNIEVFASLWSLVVFILSAFYGLFILFAGFNFIISSASPEKRMIAQEWLQNVIMLIICVQASYLFYTLIAQIASNLSQGIVRTIDQNFFIFTLDNLPNFGLQIILGIVYIMVLIVTIIVLAINYFLSSIGIIFFPFGLFFYFIPPLKDIGKFIISTTFFVLFLPFFAGLILLSTSKLVILPAFTNIKILLVITSFFLADLTLAVVILLAIMRSILGIIQSDIAKPFSAIKTKLFAPNFQKQETKFNEREYLGQPHKKYGER